MRVIQLQMQVKETKDEGLKALEASLEKIRDKQPDLVCIGEMFHCPDETSSFPVYAEKEGGESWQFLSNLARWTTMEKFTIRLTCLTGRGGRLQSTGKLICLMWISKAASTLRNQIP